jgi:phosphoserine phosphatase
MKPKRLAVFDIDKTLSREFLVVPIIRAEEDSQLLAPGTFSKVAELLIALKDGKLEYEDAAHQVLVAHAAGLQGKDITELHEHARSFLNRHAELFRRFGGEVVNLLRPTHELVAVTAEPEYMARAVVENLDMDRALASRYDVKDGKFTGKINRSLAHRTEKRNLIGDLRPDFAFGDSAGDIEMLSHAHYAFCISPDVELEGVAKEKGWERFDGEDDTEEIILSIEYYLAFL